MPDLREGWIGLPNRRGENAIFGYAREPQREHRHDAEENEPENTCCAEAELPVLRHISGEHRIVLVVDRPGNSVVRVILLRCVMGCSVVMVTMIVIEHPAQRLQIGMPDCRAPEGGEQDGEECAKPQHDLRPLKEVRQAAR